MQADRLGVTRRKDKVGWAEGVMGKCRVELRYNQRWSSRRPRSTSLRNHFSSSRHSAYLT